MNPSPSRNWEQEIVYQIFPRSYRDSNGDGIGDMRGIEEALPEIKALGCTAIYLNPIYKSRVYHNYFADDWFDIDPAFGTMADFKHMVEAAHKSGIKVLLDTEPQFVAGGQEWFADVLKNPKSPYGDYLWNQDSRGKWMTDFSPWYDKKIVPITTVNVNKPEVREAMLRHYKFWAETGLDGFRIDHCMDDLDWKGQKTGMYAQVWDPIMAEIRKDHPGMHFVAEQSDWDSAIELNKLMNGHKFDAAFAFRLRAALLTYNKRILEKALNEMNWYVQDGRTLHTFLENHDLDRFASLEKDVRKQRLMAALLFAMKGTPNIYYGQELGMKGMQGTFGSDGNDIPVRLAYRWGPTLAAKGTAHWYKGTGPWDETGASKDHDGVSLEEERGHSGSLYELYKKLIHVRLGSEALRHGDQQVKAVGEALAFTRSVGKETVWMVANLSPDNVNTSLPVGAYEDLETGHTVDGKFAMSAWGWRILRAK